MWEESGKILGGEECVCEGVSCVRFVHGCYQEPGNQGQPYRPRLVGICGSDLIRNDYNWRGKNLHTQSTLSHAGMVSSSESTACEVTTCQK